MMITHVEPPYAPLRAARGLQATSRFPDFTPAEDSSSISDEDMTEMEIMIMSFKNEVSELKVSLFLKNHYSLPR